jgi:thiamine pyrophosphokinase
LIAVAEHQVDTVVVFASGAGRAPSVIVPQGSVVIAADGGAELALALGVPVDLVVGDLDSIAPATLEALEGSGTRIEGHPREKDSTDLALAFDAALAFAPRRIVLAGAADGRVDHLLGELLLLGADDYAGVEIDAVLGPAAIHVVRGERSIVGTPGELVSLFALHGPAVGVVTEGLVYPLHGETLTAGSSRGISNVFAAETARITLDQGVLLALRPGDDS